MVKILGKYVLRHIDGEYVLFPLRANEGSFPGICSFNETGAFIWRQIEKRCDRLEIASCLSKEYGVDALTAARNTVAFLQELEDLSVIEVRANMLV